MLSQVELRKSTQALEGGRETGGGGHLLPSAWVAEQAPAWLLAAAAVSLAGASALHRGERMQAAGCGATCLQGGCMREDAKLGACRPEELASAVLAGDGSRRLG